MKTVKQNFRQRVFKHHPGPELSNNTPFCFAMDTPYGLSLNEAKFIERIVAGEYSAEFIREIATSTLPDANVADLARNLRDYFPDRKHTKRFKYWLNGLAGSYDPIDVPVTGGNCIYWWWALDGSYRKAEGIPDSKVAEWLKKEQEILQKK